MRIAKETEKRVIVYDMTKKELLESVKKVYETAKMPGYDPREIVAEIKEFTENKDGFINTCIPAVNVRGCFSLWVSIGSGRRKYSYCLDFAN